MIFKQVTRYYLVKIVYIVVQVKRLMPIVISNLTGINVATPQHPKVVNLKKHLVFIKLIYYNMIKI